MGVEIRQTLAVLLLGDQLIQKGKRVKEQCIDVFLVLLSIQINP